MGLCVLRLSYADNVYLLFMFRSLPPLAKKYVLQLLFIDIPVTTKSMEEWVLTDGFSKHKVAIDRLIQLRVLSETVDRYSILFFNFLLFIFSILMVLYNFLFCKRSSRVIYSWIVVF